MFQPQKLFATRRLWPFQANHFPAVAHSKVHTGTCAYVPYARILSASLQLLFQTLVLIVSAGNTEIICTFEEDACALVADDSLEDVWEVTQGIDFSDNTLNLSELSKLNFFIWFITSSLSASILSTCWLNCLIAVIGIFNIFLIFLFQFLVKVVSKK